MSTYRGWDTGLIARVGRARGDRYYLDKDALRGFGSFAGMHCPIGDDEVVVVESVLPPERARVYRVVSFRFDPAEHGEMVHVVRVADDLTRGTANRALRDYVATRA